MFYGAECPHCHKMMPIVDKVEKDMKIKIEKLEVWHNEENADQMRKYEVIVRKSCDGEFGVPAFISEKTKKGICGEISEKELSEWIKSNS